MNREHDQFTLRPEGLWVSPTGQRIPVIEHLHEIQHNPHTFDLTPQDVDVMGLPPEMAVHKLSNIALHLIRQGWIRSRMFGLVHHFDVRSIEGDRERILDLLKNVAWPFEERVEITSIEPPLTIQETVEQFIASAVTRSFPSEAHRNWSLSWRVRGSRD